MTETVVITGIARTPMGAFKGAFTDVAASELGAVAIRAAVSEANVASDSVEQVMMGCAQPIITCSTESDATLASDTAALMATAPSSEAATSVNAPLKAPMGVRAMPVITTVSVILSVLSNGEIWSNGKQ